MTLNQLEYALALQRHGSFNKASERLGITQPALSTQIKKLEEEINIQIFNRKANPIEVTLDGAKFLERSQQVLTDARRLINFSQELGQLYNDVLRIGVIPTLAPFLIPLFSDDLQRDYPDFHLDFHELTTENVIAGVREGRLDVGMISTPVNVPGIISEPLFYEKFYLYTAFQPGSRTHFDLQDINYDELWLLNEGNCFRDQINDFCDLSKIREHKHFIYRSNSIDALIRIVDTKGGMTILPELSMLSLDEEQEERIIAIGGRPKAREISLIMTKHYDKKRFIERLAEYVKKNIPKHMLTSNDYEVVDPRITLNPAREVVDRSPVPTKA